MAVRVVHEDRRAASTSEWELGGWQLARRRNTIASQMFEGPYKV